MIDFGRQRPALRRAIPFRMFLIGEFYLYSELIRAAELKVRLLAHPSRNAAAVLVAQDAFALIC